MKDRICVSRPAGGTTLNGPEYLLDMDGVPGMFLSEKEARDFLLKEAGMTSEDIENEMITFVDAEEVMKTFFDPPMDEATKKAFNES